MAPSRRLLDEIRQSQPFPSPAQEAAVGLLRTADAVRRGVGEVVGERGITQQQYNVLRILRGSHPEPLPTLDLAARMIEAAPGITRLLDRLEAKGLVGRRRCKDDRRQVLCSITPPGLDLLAALDQPLDAALSRGMHPLGEAKLAALTELLDQVRAGFAAARKPAAPGPEPTPLPLSSPRPTTHQEREP
ncbi:MAG: MarR family transcriptional regulator [Thermoanaerobaculia bacterium]|jgi:DNA-binding MarR family transcriptional regulator|nr:MAG: MarR family transcriptional regulator [Thermoanaerobaculia bacterium]MBZ0103969.1 MarR family transcriptional regulator [Thermoanaerobaculia bacterium]